MEPDAERIPSRPESANSVSSFNSQLSQESIMSFKMRGELGYEIDTDDENEADPIIDKNAVKQKDAVQDYEVVPSVEAAPESESAPMEPEIEQKKSESVPEMEPQMEEKRSESVPMEPEIEEKSKEFKEDQEDNREATPANDQRSTEEDPEEVDAPTRGKKTARKPKRKVEKRTAFDGRDVVFVTECTQTDWSWRDKVEKTGKGRLITPRSDVGGSSGRDTGLKSILVKPESREAVSRTHTEGGSTMDTRTATDITPFSLQPNDEFGIPMLDMSSDSDSSDDDGPKMSKSHRHHLPTIGPPQILKYVRESDRLEKDTDRTSSEMDDDRHLTESTDFMSSGASPGMFGGICEFCSGDIKPFPSLDQQLSLPPEQLYCCDDYREFVEFAMTTANKLEEDVAKKNERISIKVHPHHGSKQARKMAKEQAVLRMREREMQRRQQEATGMQAAYFNLASPSSSTTSEIFVSDLVSSKKKKKGEGGGGGGGRGGKNKDGGGGGGGGGAGGGGGPIPAGAGGQGVASSTAASGVPGLAHAPGGSSYSAFMAPEVARQMKTINYQLSSQRCLEEGWTLRAPSPLDLDDLDTEVFEPEPLHPAMIASGKLNDRKLIQKFYPDGGKFLTMFPDGTGNVFYPSGNVAILILSIALGQYTYLVYDDVTEGDLLAVFGPNGVGCCHFANGKIRLNYDQLEGLELDVVGGKKRLWSWRDQETHVHAPPFQPIVFGMNRHIGVRFMAQESIALTLTGKKRSCRFNVGAKLKLVAPENVQPRVIDENLLYIAERKVRVDTILDKVSTLLKFPKSPKVDRILPPLSVKSRQDKVDRLRRDYLASSAQTQTGAATGRKQKKQPKQSRLSPLPVISVN